jgi:hypothetical protein
MEYTVNLTTASQALAAQFGATFAASRLGGERRLAAALSERFGLAAEDSRGIVNALVRRQALCWIAERGLPHPCPGVLELVGHWRIEPDRLREI